MNHKLKFVSLIAVVFAILVGLGVGVGNALADDAHDVEIFATTLLPGLEVHEDTEINVIGNNFSFNTIIEVNDCQLSILRSRVDKLMVSFQNCYETLHSGWNYLYVWEPGLIGDYEYFKLCDDDNPTGQGNCGTPEGGGWRVR